MGKGKGIYSLDTRPRSVRNLLHSLSRCRQGRGVPLQRWKGGDATAVFLPGGAIVATGLYCDNPDRNGVSPLTTTGSLMPQIILCGTPAEHTTEKKPDALERLSDGALPTAISLEESPMQAKSGAGLLTPHPGLPLFARVKANMTSIAKVVAAAMTVLIVFSSARRRFRCGWPGRGEEAQAGCRLGQEARDARRDRRRDPGGAEGSFREERHRDQDMILGRLVRE